MTGAGRAHSPPQGCHWLLGIGRKRFPRLFRKANTMSSAGPAKGTVGNDFVCLSACLCGLGTASFLWSLGDFLQPLIFPIKCEFLQITSSTFYPLIYGRLYNSLIFLSSPLLHNPTHLPSQALCLEKTGQGQGESENCKTCPPPCLCSPLSSVPVHQAVGLPEPPNQP